MAVHLLAAALVSDDSFSPSDCEAALCPKMDKEALQEAMSHTATQGMHDASDEAIGHTSCSDPKNCMKRKMQRRSEDAGKSTKIPKVDFAFKQAPATDGMLQCIFVEGGCIPLWPQYVHKTTEGNFIRVGAREPWVLQFLTSCKKAALQGCEAHKHLLESKPFHNKVLAEPVCNGCCLNSAEY